MRDIKFRGKRLDNGEWIYGSLLVMDGEYEISDHSCIVYSRYQVDEKTVGQLSNQLTRKVGQEVFEGDLIIHNLITGMGEPFRKGLKHTVTSIESDYYWYSEIRIVGNIHDNPELL